MTLIKGNCEVATHCSANSEHVEKELSLIHKRDGPNEFTVNSNILLMTNMMDNRYKCTTSANTQIHRKSEVVLLNKNQIYCESQHGLLLDFNTAAIL